MASLLARPAEEVFTLLEKMEFADKSQVLAVSKAEISELRTRPIKLGANDHLDGLTLGNDSGEERHVRTCVEYDEALRLGFYARNTFEIKMSVFFEHQCGLLMALAKATLATASYIAEPRVGLPDLHLLPFSMFPDPSASVSDLAASTETYEDNVDRGELVIKNIGSAILNIEEPEGMGQQLVEVVRADFDGDGVEDILLFEYCYATHGTLGFGGLRLLSRKSSAGPFETSTI